MGTVKGIPSSESIWLERRKGSGEVFYITTKGTDMSMFFLYKDEDGKAVKIGKNKSPIELERKYVDCDEE